MHPVLFGTRAYPLFVAMAVLIGVATSLYNARRTGLSPSRWIAFQLLIAAAALLGAKLFAVWEQGELATLDLARLVSGDAFRYPGGLLAVLFVLPLAGPIGGAPLAVLCDATAPGIAAAMAVVRGGCLLQGCCFGHVTELPWGLQFPPNSPAWNAHLERGWIGLDAASSLPVHPLQLYFALWSALVAIVLLAIGPRRRSAGMIFLLFLVLHEGGKAALETLRVPPRPNLQLASLAVAATAALGLVALEWRRRRLAR